MHIEQRIPHSSKSTKGPPHRATSEFIGIGMETVTVAAASIGAEALREAALDKGTLGRYGHCGSSGGCSAGPGMRS